MNKYDEIIEKLESYDIEVPEKHEIRPQTAGYIEQLLDIIEKLEREPKTQTTLIFHLTPIQERIIKTITDEGQIRFKELAELLEMKQNHLWNELNILLQFGLVEKETISHKNVVYRIPRNE